MNNEETKILNVTIEEYDVNKPKSLDLLKEGKYRIERILGQGGFGITYLAIRINDMQKVAIKEFFLKEYCLRDSTFSVHATNQTNQDLVDRYLQKFLKEARTITKLNHDHIIHLYETFQENNTAYYVMEYIEGETLDEIVKREGKLEEQDALNYIQQVASALAYLHDNKINHLDVKPSNIMIRKDDKHVVLIDFGGAKQYNQMGNQTSTTPVGISHGYAPIEQYSPNGVSSFSPQTDIYSLGATFYKLVTGKTPPSAIEMSENIFLNLSNIDSSIKYVIERSMATRRTDRFSSIILFQEALIGKDAMLRKWDASSKGKIYKLLKSMENFLIVLMIISAIMCVGPILFDFVFNDILKMQIKINEGLFIFLVLIGTPLLAFLIWLSFYFDKLWHERSDIENGLKL